MSVLSALNDFFSPPAQFAGGESTVIANVSAWTPSAGGFARKTLSGEVVSASRALAYSPYFACIRNIAEDIGKLPLEIFSVDATGGRTLARDNSLFDLLGNQPNPEMTSNVFRELLSGWSISWGNGYAEIERGPSGEPIALWPIHPSRCWLKRDEHDGIVLDVWAPDARMGHDAVRLLYDDVLHIRGFGDDPMVGISMISLAANSVGAGLAAQNYGAAFFQSGGIPSIILSHPGTLSPAAQTALRDSWKKRLTGDNKNGVAVVQEGVKVERITIPPEDMQFIETQKFQVEEMARWFRMPPHMIQDLSASTNNNIEHQGIEYLTNTLAPWLNRWERELERKLLAQIDRARLEIKHNDQVLLRGDLKTRVDYLTRMVSGGLMTPNEARRSENLNPYADKSADMLFIQGAMVPLDRLALAPQPQTAAPVTNKVIK